MGTVVRLLDRGRMFRTTGSAQLRASEDQLGTNDQAFSELNPPPSQDLLEKRVSALLGDAEDLADQTRIAVARDRTTEYGQLARSLHVLAGRIGRLESRVQ